MQRGYQRCSFRKKICIYIVLLVLTGPAGVPDVINPPFLPYKKSKLAE